MKQARLQCQGRWHDITLTDEDGTPLPPAVSASIRVAPGQMPVLAVEFCDPQIDIIADIATLERLLAAEEACGLASHLVRALALPPAAAGKLHDNSFFRKQQELREALNAWRCQCGREPLPEGLPDGAPDGA